MIYIILISVLIISFLLWQYVFLIYEVKIELTADKIKVNQDNLTELIAYPINSMGKKVPFRSVDIEIEFESGEHLVSMFYLGDSKKKAAFYPVGDTGTVNVIVNSKYSFAPAKIEFEIIK